MLALNDGALCLMTSIGHRVGLFDAMHNQPPTTSAQIADRAGLDERYVREWLGAMVTSGVVIVDADSTTYHLPAEHAAFLTRAAGADNLACMTVSRAQGGEGLGAMWGEEKTREYLASAGFRTVEKRELAHDIQNDWYVVRK